MGYPAIQHLIKEYKRTERRLGHTHWQATQAVMKTRNLAQFVAPNHVLKATTDDIEDWLDTLSIQPTTRATYVSNLRSFFAWARRAGWITIDPTDDVIRPKQPRRLPRPIDNDALAEAWDALEVEIAKAATDEFRDDNARRTMAIVSLMAYEGLRCLEVSRLRGEHINVGSMELIIRGKGDKERAIPLHAESLVALQRYRLPRRGPVIVRHNGVGAWELALAPRTISQYVSRFLPDHWTAHTLRHWYGTWFYRTCKDLLLTQEVMGHSRPETTAGYAQADTSSKAEVASQLAIQRTNVPGRLNVIRGGRRVG